MFQLYDATRRRICVAAFLTFGLLPTLVVGGWCWSRHTWGSLQAEAEQLSRQLGLNVNLGGLKHLRPGVVLYEQFAAADPETGRPIFRCRLLEIARQSPSWFQSQSPADALLTAKQPEVEAASLDRLWQCVQRPLEGFCGPLEADMPARGRRSDITGRGEIADVDRGDRGDGKPAEQDSCPARFPPGGRRCVPARSHRRDPQPAGVAAGQRI